MVQELSEVVYIKFLIDYIKLTCLWVTVKYTRASDKVMKRLFAIRLFIQLY